MLRSIAKILKIKNRGIDKFQNIFSISKNILKGSINIDTP
jgi:hypothetical protein